MQRVQNRRKLRVKNKARFAMFITMLAVTSLAFAQVVTSPQANQPTFAFAEDDFNAMPVRNTIYVAPTYTEKEIEMLAKTVYGEALVTNSQTEMSAVVWCILNRVDAEGYGCGHSIEYVITFPGQFSGYRSDNPVEPEIDALVRDVLNRWTCEKSGEDDIGRTLPKDYLFFIGNGKTNYYTKEWQGTEYWNWSLESPYES